MKNENFNIMKDKTIYVFSIELYKGALAPIKVVLGDVHLDDTPVYYTNSTMNESQLRSYMPELHLLPTALSRR